MKRIAGQKAINMNGLEYLTSITLITSGLIQPKKIQQGEAIIIYGYG